MYEIWSVGHKPYEGMTIRQVSASLLAISEAFISFLYVQIMENIEEGFRLPPPPGTPRAIYELMINIW